MKLLKNVKSMTLSVGAKFSSKGGEGSRFPKPPKMCGGICKYPKKSCFFGALPLLRHPHEDHSLNT